MVRMAADAKFRVSKRGLVLAGGDGETVLFEHPKAGEFPTLLAADPEADVLREQLGPPLDDTVIDDLIAMGILTDSHDDADPVGVSRARAVRLTRSGLMIPGIATPARWMHRLLAPVVLSLFGRLAIVAVVVAGIVFLLAGHPDVPPVSGQPGLEAVLMIVLGLAATVAHELAHAAVLIHYGVTPRRAGFGFYWGAISFFVDSTPAMTLPRNARVIQALAGLAVDAVTVCVFAILAHTVSSTVWALVFWRLAVLMLVEIGINLAPILQVDGHWAVADWLDEPDLSPRARRALGAALRGRLPADQRGLAAYGAVSLLGGIALLAAMTLTYMYVVGDLIVALFHGTIIDILLGIYYVAPIAVGIVLSTLGLVLETVIGAATRAPAGGDKPAAEPDALA